MKKAIIIFFLCFSLFSCSDNKEGQNVVEESVEIIDDYVNRLTGSVVDTKEVKNMIENGQDELLDTINSIR